MSKGSPKVLNRLPIFEGLSSNLDVSKSTRNLSVKGISDTKDAEELELKFSEYGPLHVFDSQQLSEGELRVSYFNIKHALSAYEDLSSSYTMAWLGDPIDADFIDFLIIDGQHISIPDLLEALREHLLGWKSIGPLTLIRFFDRRQAWSLSKWLAVNGQSFRETVVRPSELKWEEDENPTFLVFKELTNTKINYIRLSKRKPENNRTKFVIDLQEIRNRNDKRMTVMVKNIPNKYTQQMLIADIDLNHAGTYDFLYLPIDFKNKCNVGYAFINFLDFRHIPEFYLEFDGQRWERFNSDKICALAYARIQGRKALEKHFKSSTIMSQGEHMRPLIL